MLISQNLFQTGRLVCYCVCESNSSAVRTRTVFNFFFMWSAALRVPWEGAAAACWLAAVSWLSFFFASTTGFSNWVFWLMWLQSTEHTPAYTSDLLSLVHQSSAINYACTLRMKEPQFSNSRTLQWSHYKYIHKHGAHTVDAGLIVCGEMATALSNLIL